MKKALVFGANGYLGKHMAHFLLKKGFEVIPTDIQPVSAASLKNYFSCDISVVEDVVAIDLCVDYIFVFAGLTGTAEGFKNYADYIRINETGLLNILQQAVEQGSEARIVYPSTRLVYRGRDATPLAEDSEKEAKTIYAANKIACELYLEMYSRQYGLKYSIFRICVPYGNVFGEAYSYGTIGYFLSRAKAGEDILLYGDGSQRRTFTHVEDIAIGIIKALQYRESENQVYNIGGENLSLKEAAGMIASKFDVGIIYSAWPPEALSLESGDTIFDAGKLHTLIGECYHNDIETWVDSL